MKVLHLLQSDRFSGAENVVCQIINMFKDDKNIEMVYCSRDGQIREALEERGITFAPIKDLTVKEVKRVLREQKPDIVHAHDMNASFKAALVCGKTPLISHIHNNAFNSRGLSLKSIVYYYAAKKAKQIIWVSNSSYEGYAFHKSLRNKSTVLYNVIDIDALYQKMSVDTNSYDYDVVYIGRLTYQKNPHRLLEVCSLLIEKKKDVKIAIIGTGDLESKIRRKAEELNLLDNVEFMGFQSNPLKILHDSKVMVMTSLWEGTPMCALEAMSLGVPIVSTPVDGMKDLIINGENGYLSNNNDALAQKICEIISDNKLQQKMGNSAKAAIEKLMNKQIYVTTIKNAYINR